MRDRLRPRTVWRELRRGLPDMLEVLKALPALARATVERAPDGRTHAGATAETPAPPPSGNAVAYRRRELFMVAATFLLGGILWVGLRIEPQWLGSLLAVAGLGGMAALLARS